MKFIPCRICGNPVNTTSKTDISSCCSRSKCVNTDNGVGSDKPNIEFTEKKFKAKINLLTRGY